MTMPMTWGKGAGFYVDATEAPWRDALSGCASYIEDELPAN